MNYKVKVKEVRTWTFLVSAKDSDEAAHKAKGIAMTEDSPHDSTFEHPEVSELDEKLGAMEKRKQEMLEYEKRIEEAGIPDPYHGFLKH